MTAQGVAAEKCARAWHGYLLYGEKKIKIVAPHKGGRHFFPAKIDANAIGEVTAVCESLSNMLSVTLAGIAEAPVLKYPATRGLSLHVAPSLSKKIKR